MRDRSAERRLGHVMDVVWPEGPQECQHWADQSALRLLRRGEERGTTPPPGQVVRSDHEVSQASSRRGKRFPAYRDQETTALLNAQPSPGDRLKQRSLRCFSERPWKFPPLGCKARGCAPELKSQFCPTLPPVSGVLVWCGKNGSDLSNRSTGMMQTAVQQP